MEEAASASYSEEPLALVVRNAHLKYGPIIGGSDFLAQIAAGLDFYMSALSADSGVILSPLLSAVVDRRPELEGFVLNILGAMSKMKLRMENMGSAPAGKENAVALRTKGTQQKEKKKAKRRIVPTKVEEPTAEEETATAAVCELDDPYSAWSKTSVRFGQRSAADKESPGWGAASSNWDNPPPATSTSQESRALVPLWDPNVATNGRPVARRRPARGVTTCFTYGDLSFDLFIRAGAGVGEDDEDEENSEAGGVGNFRLDDIESAFPCWATVNGRRVSGTRQEMFERFICEMYALHLKQKEKEEERKKASWRPEDGEDVMFATSDH